MSGVWPYLAAILPTILVAIFFYFIVKSMLEGDRRERMAQKRFEAEQDALRGRGENPPAEPTAGPAVERAAAPEDPSSETHGN